MEREFLLFSLMLISKTKKSKQSLKRHNLIPNEGICYTYCSQGKNVKNNLLLNKVEL